MSTYIHQGKITIPHFENRFVRCITKNVSKKCTLEIKGFSVKATSDRYKCFLTKGYDCVACGAKGSFFAIEKAKNNLQTNKYHLNLYAINSDNKEILMTKDHIFPKSKGGKDQIENYQPMCIVCNKLKSDKIVGE
jgi:hypothetical protein